jgi:hypothetical protein
MTIADERVIGIVLSLIGAVIIIYTLIARHQAGKTQQWPSTEGKVVFARVRYIHAATSTVTVGSHQMEIRYQYTVAGAEFTSLSIAPYGWSLALSEMQRIAQRYPQNSPVRVYYNPAQISESVLDPGAPHWLNVLHIPGCLLVLAGLVLFLMSYPSPSR